MAISEIQHILTKIIESEEFHLRSVPSLPISLTHYTTNS